jgi:hypothetical protein
MMKSMRKWTVALAELLLVFGAAASAEADDVAQGRQMLFLQDETGELRAAFGSTSLERVRTGDTEVTAPSSLILFDKQHHVIWKAP